MSTRYVIERIRKANNHTDYYKQIYTEDEYDSALEKANRLNNMYSQYICLVVELTDVILEKMNKK